MFLQVVACQLPKCQLYDGVHKAGGQEMNKHRPCSEARYPTDDHLGMNYIRTCKFNTRLITATTLWYRLESTIIRRGDPFVSIEMQAGRLPFVFQATFQDGSLSGKHVLFANQKCSVDFTGGDVWKIHQWDLV
jgi:hypothetical protein